MQAETAIHFRLTSPRRGLYLQLLAAWAVIVVLAMLYCWLHSLVASGLAFDAGITLRWAVIHWGAWPLLLPVCFAFIRYLHSRMSLLVAAATAAPLAIVGSALWASMSDYALGGGWQPMQAMYHMTPVAGGTYLVFVAVAFWLLSPASADASGANAQAEIETPGSSLAVSTGSQDRRIPAAQVHWIRGARNYAELHAAESTYIMRSSLRELEALLSAEGFVRVHRSYLVNQQFVIAAQPTRADQVQLSDGTKLPVGRTYRSRVEQLRKSEP